MDQTQSVVMESTGRLLRKTIHTFLKHFECFSTTPALLLLPFSASVLLTEEAPLATPSSSSVLVLNSLSESMSEILVDMNLTQTMFVYLLSLPFTLSTFLMAKACIIQALNPHKPSLFGPLLLTQLSSLVLITIINMVCFIFGLSFMRSSSLFLVLARVVVCAFWANMLVISNLALVVAGMEDCKGFAAIYKACLLRKGKHSMALLLTLPTSLCVAAIEGLFRFRILQVYHSLGGFSVSIALEGMLIAYLYSLLVVLDTIACCLFYKNCQSSLMASHSDDLSYYDIENVQEKPESLVVLQLIGS